MHLRKHLGNGCPTYIEIKHRCSQYHSQLWRLDAEMLSVFRGQGLVVLLVAQGALQNKPNVIFALFPAKVKILFGFLWLVETGANVGFLMGGYVYLICPL